MTYNDNLPLHPQSLQIIFTGLRLIRAGPQWTKMNLDEMRWEVSTLTEFSQKIKQFELFQV